MNNTVDEMAAFGWDDEIEYSEGGNFTLLPEGEYPFIVTNFERSNYTPGPNSKAPACNMAVISVKVTAPNGDETTLKEQFLMYEKMKWKLSQFFVSIGQQKKGEALRPNWQALLGAQGKLKLIVNSYKDKKTGEDKQNNRVDRYLEPEEPNYQAQQTAAPGYQAPQQGYQQPVNNQQTQQPPVPNQAPQQNVTPFPQQTAAPQNDAGYNF